MAQGMAMMYLKQNIMETMKKTMDVWQAGNAVDDTCKALAEQSRYGDNSAGSWKQKARSWTPAWIQTMVTRNGKNAGRYLSQNDLSEKMTSFPNVSIVLFSCTLFSQCCHKNSRAFLSDHIFGK